MSLIKPKIISRFLFRRFLSATMLVLLIVCGAIFTITLVDKLDNSTSLLGAAHTSWGLLLEYTPMFLPLAVFMGTLLASYNLTKSTESIIVQSAGLSPWQSMKSFLAAALLFGCAATMIVNPHAVRLSRENTDSSKLTLIDKAVWLRESNADGFMTIRATGMRTKADSIDFQNASAFVQTPDSKLIQRIEAKTITLESGKLETSKSDIFLPDGSEKKNQNWHARTALTPSIVLNRYLKPDQVSFWRLPEFINNMQKIGVDTKPHWTQFWTLLFLPITLIAMAVLGVAFSQTHERRNYSFGPKFGIGIIASFGLYFLIKVFSVLGASGSLPPVLAVLAPTLLLALAAATFISSFDTI